MRRDQTPKAKAFLEEIAQVCKRYGLSLTQEDQGAFLVEPYAEYATEWLLDALDYTKPKCVMCAKHFDAEGEDAPSLCSTCYHAQEVAADLAEEDRDT